MTPQELLAARVEQLASELREARREIAILQKRRAARLPAPVVAIAMGVTIIAASSWQLRAQSGTPAKFVAPFQIVNGAGQTLFKVEEREPGKGQLSVVTPGGGGVVIGTGSSGSGFVLINKADGKEAASIGQQANGPMAIRFASTDGATTVARLGLDGEGLGLLRVGDEKAGGFDAGAGHSGSGFMAVRRPDGKDAATLARLETAPMALRIMAANGSATATLGLDSGGQGQLVVGSEAAGGATIGVGDSATGFVVVRSPTGQPGLSLGRMTGGPLALRVFDGPKMVGQFGLDATGHSGAITLSDSTAKPLLRVAEKVDAADAHVTVGNQGGSYAVGIANASGTSVAVLGEAKIGGGVMAVKSAAGTIRAIVSGTGQIHVAAAGGETLATMVAENGEGAFSVRTPSGTTVSRLGQGAAGGMLQLADLAGNAMVEGGVVPGGGQGLVRAFPIGSPGRSIVGMPGTFIIGVKK